MSREPTLDELIGADTSGAERQRLQDVHQQLLEAGPPPELSPELEAGPTLGMMLQKKRRVKGPAMALLAAAVAIAVVFLGGYMAGNHGGTESKKPVKEAVALQGTQFAPNAEGALQVWDSRDGNNWPMTLTVAGLSQLPPHTYYEVYLYRDGKIQNWGKCGTFRVGSSSTDKAVTVTLTSPYTLEKGDSWVVTRPGPQGGEPGQMVLRPAPASA